MLIFLILGAPIIFAAGAFFAGRNKFFGAINSAGYFVLFVAGSLLFWDSLSSDGRGPYFGFIYIDALSAFFIFTISMAVFAAALYSCGYINNQTGQGRMTRDKARLYYILFNLFCLSMFFVPAVNNLGMLWVAVEMTTLISAFLVGFYNSKESVEAAWKYIIICSVGIIFALLGTILFSYAFSLSGGSASLNWQDMAEAAGRMDRNILKTAFIFILVGYGTKAGLAPMHTWLPDAHSQAVAPASALLSGVLLKTAVYAILRFGVITVNGAGFAYFGRLMVLFGLISLAVSCGFILIQKDLKRLLAYSSIEHIGIIAVGFGLGTPLSMAAAILHIFNHAATKSLMFFGAGNLVDKYRTHNMRLIRGASAVMPFTGFMLLLGVFALAGMPPFSIFISEMLVLLSAFLKGAYAVVFLMLGFVTVIFAALVYHFGRMIFGPAPKGMPAESEPLSIKLAFLFLFIQICILGIAPLFMGKELVWIAQRLFRL